ncbi:DUF4097 family beta strand repeat-containing protein [Portibacter lacus]|uniref:Adhesin domain-containing protein n=1 Tax=Portibacter lacus TaxID=1099794 RepID=A0AA37SMD9_9BACT|nr:hypothetical protein [Portibacter lacus]GLR17393.1 hypothetical protein GCM10007940_20080 [Portibacter lacus]
MQQLYILLMSLLFPLLLNGQQSTDKFDLKYDVKAYQSIRIHNFKGDVKVKAKQGNELRLKVSRTLKSKSNQKLKAAKEEVYLDTTSIDGEFIVFMIAPDKHFKIDDDGSSYYQGENWDNWSKKNIKDYGVEYEFEIEATVPPGVNLYAATHHKDVEVSGIQGNTTVKSHHGSVKASTGGSLVIAKTHHGDVTVDHSSSQVQKGIYKTHHGDIRTSFPSVSAMASMDSHHGSFYTDFDYQHVAQKVNIKKDGTKAKYKYSGATSIKLGSGNGTLTYRTHHGDTFINKN